MIKLENSEKYINGLAKLIMRDPTLPTRLREMQSFFIEEKAMTEDTEYINQQKNILKKAEEIGMANTGYLFNINLNEEYMIYKKIDNQMTPIIKKFEISPKETIKGIKEIIEYSKKTNLSNLMTFDIIDQDYVYSFPWYEGETDEDFNHGHDAFHYEVMFNKEDIKHLNQNKIKIITFQKNPEYKILEELKPIYSY